MSLRACFGFRQYDEIERRNRSLRYFPEDVFRYRRHLHTLLLDGNQIFDIPRNVARLSKLEKLSMADNELERVPAELFHISALREVDFSHNNLQGLPDAVKNVKNLAILDLSSNTIPSLPESLTQLRNLTQLCVNDTTLHHFPINLEGLGRLVVLEARENTLKFLPQSISKLTSLKRLDLGGNDLEELPESIGELTSLEELWLDGNDLTQLPVEIGELTSLKILDVTENRLERLPEGMENLKSLTDLLLTQNNLEDLPDGVGNIPNLSLLKIDVNHIESLPDTLGGLAELKELVLTDNMLETLPTSIGKLTKLSALNLDRNQLVGIPPEIGYCTSLTILTARENKLNRVPADIGMLPNLRIIDLCSNQLESLPASFSQLPLAALWLSENQSKPLMELQQDSDPVTKEPILTCVLLPQSTAQSLSMENLLQLDKSLGDVDSTSRASQNTGDRVRVAFAPGTADPPEYDPDTSKLVRHPTPFNKDLKKKKPGRGIFVDGRKSPDNSKRSSTASMGSSSSTPEQSDERKEKTDGPVSAAVVMATVAAASKTEEKPRSVAFAADVSDETDGAKTSRLSVVRRDTPHPNKLLSEEAKKAVDETNEPEKESEKEEQKEEGMLGEEMVIKEGLHDDKRVSFSEDVRKEGKGILQRKNTPYVLTAESSDTAEGDDDPLTKLRRRDTPRDLAAPQRKSAEPSQEALIEEEEEEEEKATKVEVAPLQASNELSEEPPMQQFTAMLVRKPGESLGFSLSGGVDCMPRYRDDNDFVYITRTTAGGIADKEGTLQPGDKIVEVNGVSFLGISHSGAVSVLKTSREKMVIVVERAVKTPKPVSIEVTPATPGPSTKLDEADVADIKEQEKATEEEKEEEPLPAGDFPIEEVTVTRSNEPLGMSIVGGVDCSALPFGGDGDSSGIYISKIVPGSVAERTNILRMGDRILAVNDHRLDNVQHTEAVSLLVNTNTLKIRVQHDPPPEGLKKVTVDKMPGEKLGLSVCGGAGAPSGNPYNDDDEGIFISRVASSGAAARCGEFVVGQRIIEVNGTTLLGSTHHDAVATLRAAQSPVTFLVCHGYTPEDGDHLQSGATSPTEAPVSISVTPALEVEETRQPVAMDTSEAETKVADTSQPDNEETTSPVADNKETTPPVTDNNADDQIPAVENFEAAVEPTSDAAKEDAPNEEVVPPAKDEPSMAPEGASPSSEDASVNKGGYSLRNTPAREEATASPEKGGEKKRKKKSKKSQRDEDGGSRRKHKR